MDIFLIEIHHEVIIQRIFSACMNIQYLSGTRNVLSWGVNTQHAPWSQPIIFMCLLWKELPLCKVISDLVLKMGKVHWNNFYMQQSTKWKFWKSKCFDA